MTKRRAMNLDFQPMSDEEEQLLRSAFDALVSLNSGWNLIQSNNRNGGQITVGILAGASRSEMSRIPSTGYRPKVALVKINPTEHAYVTERRQNRDPTAAFDPSVQTNTAVVMGHEMAHADDYLRDREPGGSTFTNGSRV